MDSEEVQKESQIELVIGVEGSPGDLLSKLPLGCETQHLTLSHLLCLSLAYRMWLF